MEEELVSELRKSRKKIGELYPVLEAEDGEILDGLHRLEADPEWKRKVVEAPDKIDKLCIRYVAHMRREFSAQEKREIMDSIAEELLRTKQVPLSRRGKPKGLTEKVAEVLSVGAHTVRRYISPKYKVGVDYRKSPFARARAERRSEIEIKIDILKVIAGAQQKQRLLAKTRIMGKANLSYNVLRKFLKSLMEKGLVDIAWDKAQFFGKRTYPSQRKARKYKREFLAVTKLGEKVLKKWEEIEPYLKD